MRKNLLLLFCTLLIITSAGFFISSEIKGNTTAFVENAFPMKNADSPSFAAEIDGVAKLEREEDLDRMEWVRSLEVAQCQNPTASFDVVSNCQYGEQFLIETTVTGLGGADAVIVSDNMGSTPQTVTSAGTVVTFGPYPNGVNVVVTITNADDDSCKIQSGNLTQTFCPTDYITVDDTYTVEDLVIDVLIDNPCAQVFNITSSTGTNFAGDGTPGIGYFSGDNTTFPISSGIILSSGDVNDAPGPTLDTHGGGTSWPGDSDLDALASSQGSNNGTNNASIIEFDFIPYTDHISFDYLMASAEYGTFQCTFADIFGFFLTDENGNTQNIAVVPNTNTPVAVTTIRDNAYNSSCSSVNPEYFDKYYGTNGLPANANPVTYRGYTVKLTAEADVIPGQTYHIKLAVADYSDTSWDTAVFLQAGSFEIGTIDLGPDLTVENQNAPCEQSSAILDSGIEASDHAEISWYKDNELIEGETEGTIEIDEDGTYTVIVIYGGSCVVSDEIVVEFAPVPEFEFDEQEESLCGYDSIILDGTPMNIDEFPDMDVFYSWYFEGNEIQGETNSELEVSEPGNYVVEVTTNLGCEGSHTFIVSDAGFQVDLGEDLVFCDQENYELTAAVEGDISGATFEWEGPGLEGETGQSVIVSQSGSYTVNVTAEGCTGSATVNLQFDQSPQFDLGSDIFTGDLEGVVLDASPSNMDPDQAHFEWDFNGEPIPENGPVVYPMDYGFGVYTVKVYGDNPDCFSIQSIEVEEVQITCGVNLTANVDITNEINFCDGDQPAPYEIVFTANYETENATEDVQFVWYLNGQVISGEEGENYTLVYEEEGDYNDEVAVEITVQGCTDSDSLTTQILVTPFETPCTITEGISPGNNDGYNDYLDLSFLNNRSGIEKLIVYNRYGNKVYEKNNYSNEWYGQDKSGDELPSSTYYYVIKLKNEDPVFGRVVRGWIYVNQRVN